MKILRTPGTRFVDLADYPFAPHYHQVTPQLRLHYVTAGPCEAAPVLMLHGEPTWSYLYRHMIPPVAAASKAFRIWRAFSRYSPWFPIGRIVQSGTKRRLTPDEIAAYDAPFPDDAYKAAARVYPSLVPVEPDDVALPEQQRAWQVFEDWHKPFICCFSDGDPITRGIDAEFKRRVPGTQGQPHTTQHGGHFIQEDAAAAFARLIISASRR